MLVTIEVIFVQVLSKSCLKWKNITCYKLKPLKNSVPSLSKMLAFENKKVCFGKNSELPKLVVESTHRSWQKIVTE